MLPWRSRKLQNPEVPLPITSTCRFSCKLSVMLDFQQLSRRSAAGDANDCSSPPLLNMINTGESETFPDFLLLKIVRGSSFWNVWLAPSSQTTPPLSVCHVIRSIRELKMQLHSSASLPTDRWSTGELMYSGDGVLSRDVWWSHSFIIVQCLAGAYGLHSSSQDARPTAEWVYLGGNMRDPRRFWNSTKTTFKFDRFYVFVCLWQLCWQRVGPSLQVRVSSCFLLNCSF